jgi:hypothetical protein
VFSINLGWFVRPFSFMLEISKILLIISTSVALIGCGYTVRKIDSSEKWIQLLADNSQGPKWEMDIIYNEIDKYGFIHYQNIKSVKIQSKIRQAIAGYIRIIDEANVVVQLVLIGDDGKLDDCKYINGIYCK